MIGRVRVSFRPNDQVLDEDVVEKDLDTSPERCGKLTPDGRILASGRTLAERLRFGAVR